MVKNESNEMAMLSIPKVDHERLKKLAKEDGRSMRGAFKLLVDNYEAMLKNKNR